MTTDAGQDVSLLRSAIRVAEAARLAGNHPFGAVLADGTGTVLLEARNTVTTSRDVTGHAETNLVRLATSSLDPATVATSTLYTSTEPCAMCAGAIYWARISAVVYALAETDLYAMTGANPANPTLLLPCREVFARGQRSISVRGPVDLPEAREVHAGFWI